MQALFFDVFGTLVDWRTSIAHQMAPHTDEPEAFADAWRARYQPGMEEVRAGRRPFVPLDILHHESLGETLRKFGLSVSEPLQWEMTLYWHHLDAWPDVAEGLLRLAPQALLAPHSNGNLRLMVDLARHNAWQWDAILGAEITGHYKPAPESYLKAAALMMLDPAECAMVAAHNGDLAAARALGFKTCFVPRPREHGPGQSVDLAPEDDWDIVASDLVDLADKLSETGL